MRPGSARSARSRAFAALAALALFQTGCSSGTETVPPACMEDTSVFLRALAAAPRPVEVDGTRISRCFARRSGAGDIEIVGATLIAVADRLSAAVRANPHAHAATELGYLIGASERGAARTEGIHYELLRRLQMDVSGLDTRSAQYRAGESAGRRSG
jgi:hypothetical protein